MVLNKYKGLMFYSNKTDSKYVSTVHYAITENIDLHVGAKRCSLHVLCHNIQVLPVDWSTDMIK